MSVTDTICLDYYDEIQKKAEKAIHGYYKRETVTFPIDIRGIVEQHGIEISEIRLNTKNKGRLLYNHGELRPIITNITRYRIYLEGSDSECIKRYILAHEFGHFILENGVLEKGADCVDPLFSKNKDELAADILASCLLFPKDLVLKTLSGYIQYLRETYQMPMEAVKWISLLSEKANVSMYYTIICYQHVKCCMKGKYESVPEQYRELFC